MRSTQIPLFTPETEWVMPEELKDLRGAKEIAIDLETNDPNLKELGSGNVTGKRAHCWHCGGRRGLVRVFSYTTRVKRQYGQKTGVFVVTRHV